MPYKDPEIARAKQRIRSARNHAQNREKINARKRAEYWASSEKRAQRSARHKARWPAFYAANRAKILAKGVARRDKTALAGRRPPDICEICGGPPNGRGKRLHYDHCHKTGAFRGWICSNCNSALGHVHDSVDHLRKLIAYLQHNRKSTAPQLMLAGI